MTAGPADLRLRLRRRAVDLHAFVASVEGHVCQRLVSVRVLDLGEKAGCELLHFRVSRLEESGDARRTGWGGAGEQFGCVQAGRSRRQLQIFEKLIGLFSNQRGEKAAQLGNNRL